jgi:hypothetical protein
MLQTVAQSGARMAGAQFVHANVPAYSKACIAGIANENAPKTDQW